MVVCNSLLRSIQHSVASKQLSAVDITKAYLQQINSVEQQLDSFLTVNEGYALQQVSCLLESIGTTRELISTGSIWGSTCPPGCI